MQTFESGGALWIKPRLKMQTAMAVAGWAAVALMAPPILGVYLLVAA